MSDTFGLRIGLEGEKAFKQSLREINNDFKVLGSEMRLATSSFARNECSIESLTATNNVLENQITAQRSKIDTLRRALDNATTSFGENDRRTQAWQIQLNNATAELNQMEREVSTNEQAIEEMSTAMREGADNTEELGDAVQRAGDEIEGAGSKFSSFSSIAKGVGVAIGTAVVAIGAAAVKASVDLINLGDDFNQAVNQISASTGATGEDLEKLGEVAQKVYTNNFGDSLEDVAEGLSVVQKTTGLMDKELQQATESGFALRDTFGYDLQESARTAQSLMQNFGISAEEAYNVIAVGAQNGADKNGDLLDTLNEYSGQFASLGLSSDEFVQALISGSESGMWSIDKVGDAVKEFNIRAKDGSDKTAEAFTSLGMNADEMMTTFANGGDEANKAFYEVVSALDSMTDPIAKNNTAIALFGTQFEDLESGILPVLSSMETGAGNMYDALSNITEIRYDNLDAALEGTSRAIQGVFLPTVSDMSAGITDAFSTLANEINKADGDMSKISTSFGNAVGEISNIVMEQLPMFIGVGMDILSAIGSSIVDNLPIIVDTVSQIVMTIFTGLISALPKITDGALQLLMALVNGIIENLPALMEAAILIVVTLVQGIGESLPQLIPAIISAVMLMCQTLIENLPLILEAALQLIIGLAQGLINAIPVLISYLPVIIDAIVQFLITGIPMIIDAGIQLLTALVTALPTIIETIVAVLPQIISSIVAGVLEGLPLIIQAGIDLLIALVQELPQIITTIVAALPQIITSIVSALLGNIDKIIVAGVQLLVALIKNLPTIIVEIVKAVPQIITGIVNAFTAQMGRITSIGENIVKGLWQGIQSLSGWLWDSISGWISGIWDGICDFFGIHSPSREMAWVGEMLVDGLAGSINKDGKRAVNSALEMSQDIMDTMNGLGTQMMSAIPTDFSANVKGSVTSSIEGNTGNIKTPTSLSMNPLQVTIQNFYNNREQDIEQLAYELEFYRQRVAFARGGS